MKKLSFISKEKFGNYIHSFSGKYIFCTWIFIILFLTGLSGQTKVKATGTGNTTGHIANLTVTNSGSLPLKINEQTVYIPSDGGHQAYVATIPETTVPPNGTIDIPVNGYCADVHTPPVPNGKGMSTSKWTPVGDTNQPVPNGTTNIIPNPTKPTFTTDDIPGITNSPGYTPNPPGTEGDIISTWPGTDIPVGGVIDPEHYPGDFAPVIVDILHHIEVAADIILKKDEYPTPFANDQVEERESVIQQTFWIVMADITGDEYNHDDFMERVYDQFGTTTGKPVTTLPTEQKEKVDEGIVDFWNAFQATGVEAKVIRNDGAVQIQEVPDTDSPGSGESEEEEEEASCKCDSLKFTVATRFGGLPASPSYEKITEFNASNSTPHRTEFEIEVDEEDDFYKMITIDVSGITVYCNCEAIVCEYYSGSVKKPVDANRGKVEISKVTVTGADVSEGGETISDNGISVDATPEKTSKNYFIKFKVTATCMADDCIRDVCIRYVSIEIKPKKKK